MSRKTARHSRAHARKRALERYGLDLTARDLDALALAIRRGQSQLIRRESLTRTHHLIVCRGRVMHAVYDKTTKAIATFLPLETEPS